MPAICAQAINRWSWIGEVMFKLPSVSAVTLVLVMLVTGALA
jgi:hypothetical protein